MRFGHLRPILATAVVLFLSCGDDSTSPPPSEGPPTDVTEVVEPTGGSVSVGADGQARLTITIPEGAIVRPTSVRLRALEAPSGKIARFAFEPSGLLLLEPAAIVVTLPEGTAMSASLGFVFERSERIPVPVDLDVDARTITFHATHLGFGDLSAFERAEPPASKTAAGEEFIDVEEIGCQFLQESLDLAILRAQAFVGAFPPDLASPLIQEYRAALLACGTDSLAGQIAAMEAIACNTAESATLNAQVVLVESATDLKTILGALVAAEGLVQLTGTDCSIEADIFETEFAEFLQAYVAHIESPGFIADFPTWDALWNELVTCLEVAGLAGAFGATEAETTIYTELFPALFARLHEVARDGCGENEDNTFYLDMLTGGHERNHPIAARELPPFSGLVEAELVDELHRCASAVGIESRTSQGTLLASGSVPLTSRQGEVRVTSDGRVNLTSDILNFLCGGVLLRPAITVRAEVPGMLPGVQLGALSGTFGVDIAAVVSALPQIEGEPPMSFDLVLERERSVCGVGSAGPIELCRLNVNTSGYVGEMEGVWSGGCPEGPLSGEFSITVGLDGTVTGTYTGSASGDITGNVALTGSLDAVASGGPCDWTGTVSFSGGVFSGSGSWNCGGGCAGTFSSGG